jgi:hypothetical protein
MIENFIRLNVKKYAFIANNGKTKGAIFGACVFYKEYCRNINEQNKVLRNRVSSKSKSKSNLGEKIKI